MSNALAVPWIPTVGGPHRFVGRPATLGIGGCFFKSEQPEVLSRWYEEHLGVFGAGESYPNGRFAQLHDPDGNAVQLWQSMPPEV